MLDEGKMGNQPLVDGEPVEPIEPVEIGPELGLDTAERNEFGEIDGDLTSSVQAEAFLNGGKTGTALVHWAGGMGAKNNQGVGDIALVAPAYDGAEPAGPGPAQAWVTTGSGTAKVTRSYTGVPTGANGDFYYITAKAAARIDTHEERHIGSTRGIHDARILPLEQRIGLYLGPDKPFKHGTSKADAIDRLQRHVDWNKTIEQFKQEDTAANKPGGATDTADKTTPDFYHDYKAHVVAGTGYAHYIDTPPGPPP